jgi:hypothetical protein
MSFGKSIIIRGDAEHIPLADKSVALTLTSPPYGLARLYLEEGVDLGIARKPEKWVKWMFNVAKECCRVTTGLVLINCAGLTRNWRYHPLPEMLMADWYRAGGECWRPAYFHRSGIPGTGGKQEKCPKCDGKLPEVEECEYCGGSGKSPDEGDGPQWLASRIEYVLAFKDSSGNPWANGTACGHIPKWGPGGEMSYRLTDGSRVNAWGHGGDGPTCKARRLDGTFDENNRPSNAVQSVNQWGPVGGPGGGGAKRANGKLGSRFRPSHAPGPSRRANGEYKFVKRHTKSNAAGEDIEQFYSPPILANPGNLLSFHVGGGAMGSQLAHINEAPFSEKFAEFFIKSFCPPGGCVLDPFSGSGTVAAVSRRLGRIGIGMDIRQSQCDLGWRRVNEPKNLQAEMFV